MPLVVLIQFKLDRFQAICALRMTKPQLTNHLSFTTHIHSFNTYM